MQGESGKGHRRHCVGAALQIRPRLLRRCILLSNRFRPQLEVLETRLTPGSLSYRQCVAYSGLTGGAVGTIAGAGVSAATLGTTMYFGAWAGSLVGTYLGARFCPHR